MSTWDINDMRSPAQWDNDLKTIQAMRRYGGGFVVALSEAALAADANNLARIKKAWPEYWAKYTRMSQISTPGDADAPDHPAGGHSWKEAHPPAGHFVPVRAMLQQDRESRRTARTRAA